MTRRRLPGELIPPDLLVLDLIYKRTRFLRDAEAAGCTVLDGELMLLHQGAAAFTLWTGKPAPLELMQQKLQEARDGGLRSAEGEPAGDEDGTTDGTGAAGAAGGDSRAPDAAGEPTGAAAPD